MSERRRYRSVVADSARWEAFRFRPDDIVVSTPPKCGTTWMQALCVSLVLDATTFPRPLSELSPWLDVLTNDLGSVLADLEAQQHRRVIKTHTPLDGLPFDEHVTYVCVGRDPRDVLLSFDHHRANMDREALLAARRRAVGLDDLAEFGPPPDRHADPLHRFWQRVDAEPSGWEHVTLSSVLHHLHGFWDRRDEPRFALFHYADLSADLPAELARLASVLSLDPSKERIAELAVAAGFDRMKERADELAPEVGNRLWHDNREFFHRGTSGQWRDLLGARDVRRYERRVAELVPPAVADWAHNGSMGAVGPEASTGSP